MDKDKLANVIADELNKQFKDHQVAYFLGDSADSPTDVTEWISSGSSILDLAIANKPNAGIAVGKITEINGLLLLHHIELLAYQWKKRILSVFSSYNALTFSEKKLEKVKN